MNQERRLKKRAYYSREQEYAHVLTSEDHEVFGKHLLKMSHSAVERTVGWVQMSVVCLCLGRLLAFLDSYFQLHTGDNKSHIEHL